MFCAGKAALDLAAAAIHVNTGDAERNHESGVAFLDPDVLKAQTANLRCPLNTNDVAYAAPPPPPPPPPPARDGSGGGSGWVGVVVLILAGAAVVAAAKKKVGPFAQRMAKDGGESMYEAGVAPQLSDAA